MIKRLETNLNSSKNLFSGDRGLQKADARSSVCGPGSEWSQCSASGSSVAGGDGEEGGGAHVAEDDDGGGEEEEEAENRVQSWL